MGEGEGCGGKRVVGGGRGLGGGGGEGWGGGERVVEGLFEILRRFVKGICLKARGVLVGSFGWEFWLGVLVGSFGWEF